MSIVLAMTTITELSEKAKNNKDYLIYGIIQSFPDKVKTIQQLKDYNNQWIPIPEWNKSQVIEYSQSNQPKTKRIDAMYE